MSERRCCALTACPVRGVLTVLGGFLVHLTLSTTYVFGNVTPYVTSYLRERSSSENASYTETIWISTAQSLSMAAAMPILGLADQRIPPKYCVLIGAWIYSAGMALTFFTVKKSLALTILTYGVIHGMGKGMAYPSAVKCALQWFPGRKGLVTGLVIAGIGGGTFAFNEVITYFVNPHNLLPQVVAHKDLYFDQPALLDRVPYCFLMLGGIYASIQLLAVLLIGRPQYPVQKTESDDSEQEDTDQSDSRDVASKRSFSPVEVLRSPMFYVLWLIYVCTVLGIFFVSNFYKTFSQTFIKDDHFLAMAGSISSILNAVGRPVWGAVGDKLGYREALVVVLFIFGSAGVTFTLCEYGGKVMLIVWMCLIYGTFSGFYCIMPSLIAAMYGYKYYSTNYGLLFTAMIVAQVGGALLAAQLRRSIGWTGILYIGAGGVLFSLLIATVMMIRHRRMKKMEKTLDQVQAG